MAHSSVAASLPAFHGSGSGAVAWPQRQKIDAAASTSRIVIARGVGYMLAARTGLDSGI